MRTHRPTVLVLALALAWPSAAALAGCRTGDASFEPVELTDADLAEIRSVMIANAPVLAASPGIKATQAQCSDDVIHAQVIFYPHSESGGIGEAVKASCQKPVGGESWACPSSELRLYVQVPGQDFQVRINGQLDYEHAIALIDATRGAGPARTGAGWATDTAVIISGGSDGLMWVGWGDHESHVGLSVEARLIPGGDPRRAADWQVVGVNDGS